jgi:N-acyl-L-homoserine lactone synthetase
MLSMGLFPGITFKVATGLESVEAIRLRSEIYQDELGHSGVDEFDQSAHHLIAVDSRGEICAAIRILGPEHRPFEIERFVSLNEVVAEGRVAAQIGGFWVRSGDRRVRNPSFLPLGMLKLAYEFARKRQITDFVMRTHITKLRRFYERGFFRLVEGMEFTHPDWGPVYVMHLDLLEFRRRHAVCNDPIAAYLLSETLDPAMDI